MAEIRDGIERQSGEKSGDPLQEKHERICDDNEESYDGRCGQNDVPPVIGSDGLRNNFGKDEDEQCEYSRSNSDVCVAEYLCGLCTDERSSDSVCDGVECEYGRNGVVDVVFVLT